MALTISRPIPVSRNPTAQLTTHVRRRETPAEYPPASPDQSSGTLDQQRTTELGNEMRAVYTARIGDQDLSPTVRDLYRLVTTLAAEAVPYRNPTRISAVRSRRQANMVRTIDRYVRETTSDYNTAFTRAIEPDPGYEAFTGSMHTWATMLSMCVTS